jgi:hypothetical protein
MTKPFYAYGDEVYLKTDIDQRMRIVSGYIYRPGAMLYMLACGQDESSHYEFELSETRNVMMTSTN